MLAAADQDLVVQKCKAACGAEVLGVDLRRPLSEELARRLQAAWDENIVLVIRGQDISQDEQLRFAANFGSLGERRRAPEELRSRVEGVLQLDPRVLLVSNMKKDGVPIGAFGDGDMWFHIDAGYTQRPYRYTFLYSLTLPDRGGDTLFSNMCMAYDAVPERLKRLLAGKRALHIHEYKRNEKIDANADLSKSPHWFHPIFITHPRTGKKSLFVDRLMTARLEGFSSEESDEILEQLYEIGERQDFVYQHSWKLGDLVMWDNLATIHARTWFPKDQDRLMRRCTVDGEPVRE